MALSNQLDGHAVPSFSQIGSVKKVGEQYWVFGSHAEILEM
jgi:hypothetical protein